MTNKAPTAYLSGVRRMHRIGVLAIAGLLVVYGACVNKHDEDCEAEEAQVAEAFDAWCVDMCAVAYERGLQQGRDCAADGSAYAQSVYEWYLAHPDPALYGEYSECYFVGSSFCGASNSHDDFHLDPFDYGYYEGWLESACPGDPVGQDMEHLQWPAGDSGDSESEAQPGWYPCPALEHAYSR